MSQKLDNTRISFLDLSAELRNLVYQYCFVPEPYIYLRHRYWDKPKDSEEKEETRSTDAGERSSTYAWVCPWTGPKLPIALFKTCHQVHDESKPILYGQNTFYFGYRQIPSFFEEFPALQKGIRHVRVEGVYRQAFVEGLNELKLCDQLQSVELDPYYLANGRTRGHPEIMAKVLASFLGAVQKRRGMSKEDAVEMLRFAKSDKRVKMSAGVRKQKAEELKGLILGMLN